MMHKQQNKEITARKKEENVSMEDDDDARMGDRCRMQATGLEIARYEEPKEKSVSPESIDNNQMEKKKKVGRRNNPAMDWA